MGSKTKMRIFGGLLILVLAGSMSLWGQATGTISGTVRDSSEAVVPKATVTVTQVGTNFKRVVQSSDQGEYTAPLLPVGNYTVRVDKAGFASFLQTGINLQADTQVQADAVLKVSTVAAEVTVDTKPSLLQTTSTSLVQVVDTQRIEDLPLNGRDVLDLVGLNAGVQTDNVPMTYQGIDLGFGAYQPSVSIGGTRGSSVNYMLDNTDFNNTQTNTPYPFPNPDAIREFSVQMSTFDARYGRAAGGVVNAVTRSGTNQFHGVVFDFLRNYALNAANYFSGRDTLRQNQFGATLGGPIWRDHTFFFGSYQGTRESTANPNAAFTVPSAAMLNGDFSGWLKAGGVGQVYDPITGIAFPGNIIPPGRVDPVTAKLLPLFPTAPNYKATRPTPSTTDNNNEFAIRLDQSLGDRQRLWARSFLFHLNSPAVRDPTNILYATNGQIGTFSDIAAGYSYVFSSRLLNELDVSYGSENPVLRSTGNPVTNLQSLGAQVLNVPNVSLLNISITGWTGIAFGNSASNYVKSYQVTDTVNYANGKHDLHFGADFRIYNTGFSTYNGTGGTVGFTGQDLGKAGKVNSGNSFAEFYLGVADSFSQLSQASIARRQSYYALLVQDNIRLTDRLTANLGLRWNPEPKPYTKANQWVTFNAGQQSTVFPNAPLGIVAYGDPGVGTVIPSKWNLWTPRIGLAYMITPKTVLRTAYGIFFDEAMGLYLNDMVSSLPWVNSIAKVGPLQYSNPYNGSAPLDPLHYTYSSGMAFPAFSTYYLPTHNLLPGYTQNWNLIVERQLSSSTVFRAGYVGSKGTHLANSQNENPGIYSPTATAANLNTRRRYANIGSMYLGESESESSYNSLQVTLNKHYGHGFSILANYTYSRSIDESSYSDISGNEAGPDPYHLSTNRGVSDFDATHRLVVSGLWKLPQLKVHKAVIRNVLGGWQGNGIFTTRSGNPFTVVSGVDTNFDGVGGDFADYTYASWRLPKNRSKQAQSNEWFNTSLFTIGQTGTFGTGRRNQLRQPAAWNLNASMFKEFPVKDWARLQFRGEFFNALNHANLLVPNGTVDSAAFGEIRTASPPRIIQLGLKIIY